MKRLIAIEIDLTDEKLAGIVLSPSEVWVAITGPSGTIGGWAEIVGVKDMPWNGSDTCI